MLIELPYRSQRRRYDSVDVRRELELKDWRADEVAVVPAVSRAGRLQTPREGLVDFLVSASPDKALDKTVSRGINQQAQNLPPNLPDSAPRAARSA